MEAVDDALVVANVADDVFRTELGMVPLGFPSSCRTTADVALVRVVEVADLRHLGEGPAVALEAIIAGGVVGAAKGWHRSCLNVNVTSSNAARAQ